MFYKITKKLFYLIINILKFFQVSLIFLSFFTVIYWVLQLAGANFTDVIANFFEGIKIFIHSFYQRRVVMDQVEIDFSFLVAIFVFLCGVWMLRYLIEYLNHLESAFDKLHFSLKRKIEIAFNNELEKEYIQNEYKNNKILILIKFKTEKFHKRDFYSRKADTDSNPELEETLLNECLNLYSEEKCQSKIVHNGLLLYFNNFEEIDEILNRLEEILSGLKIEHEQKDLKIHYIVSIDAYARELELVLKTEILESLSRLNFFDEITCLSTFKQRYSLKTERKYEPEIRGNYTIKTTEDVFVLKKL